MLPLLIGLLTKHLLFDFFLQGPYQYLNKGKYLHPGGLLHACLAVVGTALVWEIVGAPLHLLGGVMAIEFIVHYHMDWAKVNINAWFGWGPQTSEKYWWLLGVDQYVHLMNYVWMLWYIS